MVGGPNSFKSKFDYPPTTEFHRKMGPAINEWACETSVRYLQIVACFAKKSGELEITFDVAENGESAFVHIFGENGSARITVYNGGSSDFEIIHGEEVHLYEQIEGMIDKETLVTKMMYAIEIVRLIQQENSKLNG